MLVVSFTSGTGAVRKFESVDRVRLVGNSVQLGSQNHTVASYAAGLWFYDNGQETFDRLEVEHGVEIRFEIPSEGRRICFRPVDHVEVLNAEMRVSPTEPIARLDDLLQNWYVQGAAGGWPVVVMQSLN